MTSTPQLNDSYKDLFGKFLAQRRASIIKKIENISTSYGKSSPMVVLMNVPIYVATLGAIGYIWYSRIDHQPEKNFHTISCDDESIRKKRKMYNLDPSYYGPKYRNIK